MQRHALKLHHVLFMTATHESVPLAICHALFSCVVTFKITPGVGMRS